MPPLDTALTGVWQGLYTYAHGQSVSFTAILIEAGSRLSGSTHESCSVPDCPLPTHDAFLSGSRHDRTVTFKKTYAPLGYGYESVDYEGTLNADASEIEGHWTLPFLPAGKFLMIRTSGTAEKVAEKRFEKA